MSEPLKYKGVPVDDMTPEQVSAAVVELLTAMSDKELSLAMAEMDRIKARRQRPKAA